MPGFLFLAVVGLMLATLLFVATSDRYGLRPSHPEATQTLVAAPAPLPDMRPKAFAAQVKNEPAARAARAEGVPTTKRANRERAPVGYQQPFSGDRFSLKGY